MKAQIVFMISALLGSISQPMAQERCRVMDPTGTPLNARTQPYGQIIARLPNGLLVSIVDQSFDRNGRPWAYVVNYNSRTEIGWVFREYIACF